MNSIELVGRLVYDPQIKESSNGSGNKVLSERVAVQRSGRPKETDFINVRAFNKTAEFIAQYFHKGDPIDICGSLRVENYKKQDGTDKTDTYVLIREVNFVPSKGSGAPNNEDNTTPVNAPDTATDSEAEVPFEI